MPTTEGIHIDSDGDGTTEINLNVQLSQGLDLVGGLRVLLQAELPPGSFTAEDLRQTANNVGKRVNALGVTEPTVQVQGNNRILVELPGVRDPQVAVETIQQTALLEFVNFSGLSGQAQDFINARILTTQQVMIQNQRGETNDGTLLVNPLTNLPFETVMTGAGLQAAAAEYNQGQWLIQFELTNDGASIFGPYTAANIRQPMAIVLDGQVVSAPVIQAQLDTGGVIEGRFTEDEAKQLALQLRSGALPIPLRVESAETVGATLGQESVNLSIRAGVIGVIIVFMFMLIYYRVPGLAATFALMVFILINVALFKLIPITLTLPAITGFLISIGTAVDGNILIFERIKEEIRANKPIEEALEAGFNRAWQSIRDSNFSTIIICAILFFFGQTPGASIVAGFAVTLVIGLLVNLFTAVVVTRTFLQILVVVLRQPIERRAWLLGA
ncbi:MAG: protein translocase subunit SecD [Chloroflexota bacterium]|nr:protein translocase subunit SecD [Chloroflexota bacterium]